jgi:hypothetical protein
MAYGLLIKGIGLGVWALKADVDVGPTRLWAWLMWDSLDEVRLGFLHSGSTCIYKDFPHFTYIGEQHNCRSIGTMSQARARHV